MSTQFPRLQAALGLVLLASTAAAQTAVLTYSGEASDRHFGRGLCAAGDLDQDGVGDFALLDEAGVRLVSGRSGLKLRTLDFGVALTDAVLAPLGDVNLDGVGDFVVGAPHVATHGPGSGAAFVLDGANGERLRRLAGAAPFDGFGASVAALGDVDLDGFADFAVGASGEDPGGAVHVVSGRTGTSIWRLASVESGAFFGFAVAGTGDVDGDLVPDIACGAPQADPNGPSSGAVHLFSGATGAPVRVHEGLAANDQLGSALASAGDIDLDGHADVAIGAPIRAAARGEVRVFSGRTGELLLHLEGDRPDDRFGSAVAGGGDLDGDGYPDLAVGAPTADVIEVEGGAVSFHSGRTGQLLGVLDGTTRGELSGSALAFVGDLGQDGFDETLVGAPGADPTGRDAGIVRVVSARTLPLPPGYSLRPYCQGDGAPVACPCLNDVAGAPGGCAHSFGLAAELLAAGSPSLTGDTLTFFARGLPYGMGILLQGDRRKPVFGPAGVPFGDGLMCIGGEMKRLGVIASQDGSAALGFGLEQSLSVSRRGALLAPGTRFYQVLYRNVGAYCTPANFNLTNALELHWVP